MGAATVTFEPRSSEGWLDPFVMHRALHDHDPGHRMAAGGYRVLSRSRLLARCPDFTVDAAAGCFPVRRLA
jgi:hypothetical protein